MMDQQNLDGLRPASADPEVALAKALGQWPPRPSRTKLALKGISDGKATINGNTSVEDLAEELGLKLGDQNELTIRRIRRGKSYTFLRADGTPIRHPATIRRLHAMAVPPAYRQVRYAPDPSSHLQAVGRDA